MSKSHALKIVSTADASTRLSDLLDEITSRPVGIRREDEVAAYLVSRRDFDALIAKIDELEDLLLVARAEIARRGGFVSAEQADALMDEVRKIHDDESGDHQ